MSIVITFLGLLGLAFIVFLWVGAAASVFKITHGLYKSSRGTAAAAATHEPTLSDTWRQGLVAGAIGYAAVVVLFAGLNAWAGRNVLLTPALLGEALMGRPIGGAIEAAPVLIYNGLHLMVFLVFGLSAAWLLMESVRHPKIWYPAFVLLLVVFLHATGFVLWLAVQAGPSMSEWSVVIGSAAAGVLMATYLLAAQPGTMARLGAADLEA